MFQNQMDSDLISVKKYILKLILSIFEIKTHYFQSSTCKLQFFNDYQTYAPMKF